MRRAKIVATLGPAVDSQEQIRALVNAGMDVARINRSHGSYEEHARQIEWVRQAAEATGRPVGVLVDLQGPKIRTGRFESGPVLLTKGDRFTITTRDVPGDRNSVSTTHAGLPADVSVGDVILVDDGRIKLRAVAVTDTDVVTEVVEGGPVSNNKGINLPGVAVDVPALSRKDEGDLRWALAHGVDWVALSFVRDAADIERVHAIMDEEGVRVPVLAKIEKPQAVAHLREIIDTFDGIMVARGDLGVEMPLEEVPLLQKRAVAMARRRAKPVIVATQVLESMIANSRPTRAEASDCANAVLDGTDALMLSGETSVGAWPVLAVETMARIIGTTEAHGAARVASVRLPETTVSGAVTQAAAEIGDHLGASLIVIFTTSGEAARRMARVRARLPILAFTPSEAIRRRLALIWGVTPRFLPELVVTGDVDDLVRDVDARLVADHGCRPGDLVVAVAGAPLGGSGPTNAIRVHQVGLEG